MLIRLKDIEQWIIIISGIEINFFDNLPEKKVTLSFEVNLEKSTEYAKYA